jgi:hypothetical protein
MTTDLLTDLDRLGDLLERTSRPIDVHQIVDRSPVGLDMSLLDLPPGDRLIDDGMALVVSERRPSRASTRRWRAAATFVAAAAIVGTLWIVTSRPTDVPVAVDVPTIGTAGHMTLDAPPPGWGFELASDSIDTGDGDRVVQRIYATAGSAPETDPALLLTSMSAAVGAPGVFGVADTQDPNRIFADVQGTAGQLTQSNGGGQSLTFGPVNGYNYLLTGYHVSEDELVAAANTVHVSPDGHGSVIDETALPAGVTERGTGLVSEIWFISTLAATHPIPEAHWTDGSGELWYRSFEDPAMAPLGRFGFDTVADTTVNGHSGYVATVSPTHQQATVASVMWSDGTRTFLLASNKIGAAQLQTLAAALRPATDAEWAAMTKQEHTVRPTEATTTALGPAASGSVPAIANDLPERLASLPSSLNDLGFTIDSASTDPSTGVTAVHASDAANTRTIALTITPGTPVVPENHERVPIKILEQTDVLLRAEVDGNSGWRVEITVTRTSIGDALPVAERLQELLYSLDP